MTLASSLLRALRATVVDLERSASEANYAAKRARERLNVLELEYEEEVEATGARDVCQGPIRSQNPTLG
jgi:hypothetical protein